jgi:hypothetical protein
METTQLSLSNEQFAKLQATIIAAQMLPYFFDDKKNWHFGDKELKTPYAKASYTAMMLLNKLNGLCDHLEDHGVL